MSVLFLKWVRLTTNGIRSGTFSDHISVHLSEPKCTENWCEKYTKVVPIGAKSARHPCQVPRTQQTTRVCRTPGQSMIKSWPVFVKTQNPWGRYTGDTSWDQNYSIGTKSPESVKWDEYDNPDIKTLEKTLCKAIAMSSQSMFTQT